MQISTKLQNLLFLIIEEHISTSSPVSSISLVNKYKLSKSSATVRNEMAQLEELGLICQPHTSAGRIPTENGYLLYLENIKPDELNTTDEKIVVPKILNSAQVREYIKQLAKAVSSLSDELVFIAFSKNDTYYTGISKLFSKPELADPIIISDISTVIDRLDLVLNGVFDQASDKTLINIGSSNEFSKRCSSLIFKYKFKENIGIIGILGPMRMNYKKNLALIEQIKKYLNR